MHEAAESIASGDASFVGGDEWNAGHLSAALAMDELIESTGVST
ncbi:hypothetical protein [Streptomyces sp. NPDC005336]